MSSEASPLSSRPYRRRTWIRRHLPWRLIDRGWAGWKPGDDCEAAGDHHEFHNVDGERSRCYHCGETREGGAVVAGRDERDPVIPDLI